MEKIFYTDKNLVPSSLEQVKELLASHFAVKNGVFARTENGKPYLQDEKTLFFSVSHTDEKWFVAFCDQNVGLDAESLSRTPNLSVLVKRFTAEEREEILSVKDFLTLWTVKESCIKWLGETLSHSLRKLSYTKGRLRYEGLELPVKITNLEVDGHILSVCSERDFSSVEIIQV